MVPQDDNDNRGDPPTMLHRRRTAAVVLGAAALAASLSACGSSSNSADSGSASSGASANASSSAAAGTSGTPTDKEYCDTVNGLPDTSKYKTLGDAMGALTDWADKLEALGTPSDMPAAAASAAKTFPGGMVKAMNSALGSLDPSTPVSEVKNHKDLEKKYDAAIAPLEKTLGDGSAFDTWATSHCN